MGWHCDGLVCWFTLSKVSPEVDQNDAVWFSCQGYVTLRFQAFAC